MSVVRYLADEDLRHEIVSATRRLDPAIRFTTVIEAGLSGALDRVVLQFAASEGLLVVPHDVNTMKAEAERRLRQGLALSALFLAPQFRPTREIAESLFLIWSVSEAEEWDGRIVYLPL